MASLHPSSALFRSLKSSALKSLAVSLGVNSSGTKSHICSSILHAVSDTRPTTNKPRRVLSIDLGIRNLAFCVLQIPPVSRSHDDKCLPQLLAWRRISALVRQKNEATPEPDVNSELETYNPSVYAAHANRLVRSLLRDYDRIDTVLIERQRWRSGGGSSILEWTVRVNSFEAMLHAVFACLQEEQQWLGTVKSVSPAKVSTFWVPKVPPLDNGIQAGREDEGKSRVVKRLNPRAIKTAKIGVVGDWLRHGDMVQLESGDVRETASFFAGPHIPTKRKGAPKLDDLADCLLQAMAWTKWEQNRSNLLVGILPPGIPVCSD